MQFLLRLIGGWLPIGTKPFPEWAGKIIWVVGIYIALNLVMAHFFPAKSVTTIGQGGTQIIQQAEPRDTVGFGCNVFKLYVKGGLKAK
jgi:hypothetical protein